MARKRHYINNPDFLEAMKNWTPAQPVDDYIGACFMKIAEGLAKKPNFAGYQFLDEMKNDAIEDCLRRMHNFDPNKSSNPFSYFTQISYFAFLRRILKERRHQYVKYKVMYEELDFNTQQNPDFINNITGFIKDYEKKTPEVKDKKIGLELFLED